MQKKTVTTLERLTGGITKINFMNTEQKYNLLQSKNSIWVFFTNFFSLLLHIILIILVFIVWYVVVIFSILDLLIGATFQSLSFNAKK